MNNLIYRDKAIEAISKLPVKVDNLEYTWVIVGDVLKQIDDMPSAKLDNQVHLCGFCKYSYPECPAEMSDIIFGNGKGYDNVCSCAKFEIKQERTAKVYQKQLPDGLYYFYCGFCGEIIDCSFYDYKGIKSYCGYCGAKLDYWSE